MDAGVAHGYACNGVAHDDDDLYADGHGCQRLHGDFDAYHYGQPFAHGNDYGFFDFYLHG